MLMPQVPPIGLTLSQVVEFVPDTQIWTRLTSNDPLVQFHARFWGRSIRHEEQAWLATQPQGPIGNLVVEDNDDLNMDPYDVRNDHGNDHLDHEFIPGCFAMEIGDNPFIENKEIWVRAEYIRLYSYMESRYKRCCSSRRAQTVVIAGQPGIGKSVSLLYTIRRCCAERKPVIWYNESAGYIFVQDGVYRLAPDFQSNHFKTFVWTLVDSDASVDGIPSDLLQNCTSLFVIYASSATKKHWEQIDKAIDDVTVVMNPWTWKEIHRALPCLLPRQQRDEVEIRKIFDHLSPTPRIVKLWSDPDRLMEYKWSVEDIIFNMKPDALGKLVREVRTFSVVRGNASKVILLRRAVRNIVHSHMVIEPITDLIRSRLAIQFRYVAMNTQIEVFDALVKAPQTRPVAGTVFESIQQRVIRNGTRITIFPMIRLTRKNDGHPRWYSSHVVLQDPTLEAKRQKAQQQSRCIEIRPTDIEEFGDNIVSVVDDVLYVPHATNQEGLDSFIIFHDIFYIFRFTNSWHHSIKPSLLKFFEKCEGIPHYLQWRFVFVIPPGSMLSCPEPKSKTLLDLQPYSAVLSVPRRNKLRKI